MEEAEEESEVFEWCFLSHVADEEVGHGFGASSVESAHALEREVVWGGFRRGRGRGRGGKGVWEGGESKKEERCEEEKEANRDSGLCFGEERFGGGREVEHGFNVGV